MQLHTFFLILSLRKLFSKALSVDEIAKTIIVQYSNINLVDVFWNFKESLELAPETETMWRTLANLSLEGRQLWIAGFLFLEW